MSKRDRPIKPTRGYDEPFAGLIAAFAIFYASQMLVEGQFTYGEPDGVLVTIEDNPLGFWAGFSFPVAVAIAMAILIWKAEMKYRDEFAEYSRKKQERNIS